MKRLAILLLVIFLPLIMSAQVAQTQDSLELRVYFQQNQSAIMPSFRDNDLRLTQLVNSLRHRQDTTMHLQSIIIYTGASPEGRVSANRQLSIDRGLAIKHYFESALGLSDSIFVMKPVGEDWKTLALMVERYRVPSWQKILNIIDSHPVKDDALEAKVLEERKRLIKGIDNGAAWQYLLDNIFPELRGGYRGSMAYYWCSSPAYQSHEAFSMYLGKEFSPTICACALQYLSDKHQLKHQLKHQ